MARFLAIHSVPGMTEDEFRQALSEVGRWRPDGRTTILKVYCDLARGKLFSECEAPQQAQFEEWIRAMGWSYDAIYTVDTLHQAGRIWNL